MKLIPGEYRILDGEIIINEKNENIIIPVSNIGDRPIQVGSHYHFFEVNESLIFNRSKTKGFRLNIPSGTATRFEPGQERTVELVQYGGDRKIFGFKGKIMGKL